MALLVACNAPKENPTGTWDLTYRIVGSRCPDEYPEGRTTRDTVVIEASGKSIVVRSDEHDYAGALAGDEATLSGPRDGAALGVQVDLALSFDGGSRRQHRRAG